MRDACQDVWIGMEEKRKRGRPSQRKEVNQLELLHISMKVFADKGFAGTSMTAIARAARVNDSLLHYHFGNKEQLWKRGIEALTQELIDEFAEFRKLHKDLEGIALMKVLVRQFVLFNARYPEYYRLLSQEMAMWSNRSTWLAEEIIPLLQSLYEKTIESEQLAGRIKPLPIANMIIITFGAVNAAFHQAVQMRQQFEIEVFEPEEVDKHTDAVIETLFHGWSL